MSKTERYFTTYFIHKAIIGLFQLLVVTYPAPCKRPSSADRHHMQLHMDDSCNHWFVEPSQRPVDPRTPGSGLNFLKVKNVSSLGGQVY